MFWKSNHKKFLVCLALIVLMFGAFLYTTGINDKSIPANETVQFAIYLVDYEADIQPGTPIDKLPVWKTPLITNKDIKKYDWANHKLLLKENVDIPAVLLNSRNKEFIIVVKDVRIYSGKIYTSAAPYLIPKGNVITTDEFTRTISIKSIDNKEDPRSDKRVYDVFSKLGKLRR